MQWRRISRGVAGVLSILGFLVVSPIYAASQSSSTNYSINEVYFGAGSQLNACSTNYCSQQTAGDTAIGNTASANFDAMGGNNTDRAPFLAFSTTGGGQDLGVLSTAGTATTFAQFAVKTYLAGGYSVILGSPPPTATGVSGHTLTGLTTPTASATPGTAEQFGINLVQNTTGCGAPANVGANPVQVPSGAFSFGTVAGGYNTCGLFKYVQGNTIAGSTQSSGETDYEMSFIYNITPTTPDGYYVYNGDLIATSTF